MSDHVDTVVLVTSTAPAGDYGGKGGNARPTPWVPPAAAAAPATATQAAGPPPNAVDVQDALQRINEHLAAAGRVIELQVDAGTGLTIATIRDASNGAMLQQYPAEDSLHLAQMLAGWSHGGNVLLDLIA